MSGLSARAKAFASSREGKRAIRQATDYAKSPQAKRQLAQLKQRFAGSHKPPPR